ncbi:MAG: VOC family protein, partial [Solirubrobacterales bacterium]|nr:VOC family protein [Solirubrobacterales bacterium]
LAAGGTDAGAPAPLPQYGRSYYAGYLLDPDGYRVELVSGAH